MFKNTPAFTSFSAPDMAQMKAFYGDVLDLDTTERPEGLELSLEGGGPVFIYHSQDYTAPEHTVLNFVVPDIDATVDALEGKGVRMEQYPDFHTDEKGICRNDGAQPGPKAIAWFKDPADHILAVMQEN
jgi:catechol 2,3-dioxygenase-like lactoylglutathione lyase family enzyme